MTKHELLAGLQPFDDETEIVVRWRLPLGGDFELPVFYLQYVPMEGEKDAYVALRVQP